VLWALAITGSHKVWALVDYLISDVKTADVLWILWSIDDKGYMATIDTSLDMFSEESITFVHLSQSLRFEWENWLSFAMTESWLLTQTLGSSDWLQWGKFKITQTLKWKDIN